MQKALKAAKTISRDLSESHIELLEENNLYWVFQPIIEMDLDKKVQNTLICAIIYSYDNESTWIDLKQDGQSINTSILKGLKADFSIPIYNEFLLQTNEKINESVGNYLDVIPDWRFVTVRKHIDFHAKYIRQAENEEDFKSLDAEKKTKAREALGRLMREAVNQRKAADALISEIHRDYVSSQHRVKQDFGASFVDETIKRDIYSWREFILHDYIPAQKRKKAEKESAI